MRLELTRQKAKRVNRCCLEVRELGEQLPHWSRAMRPGGALKSMSTTPDNASIVGAFQGTGADDGHPAAHRRSITGKRAEACASCRGKDALLICAAALD